jgi:uncharacterized protein (DUF1015 family)
MKVSFNPDMKESIEKYFERDVSCAVIHMKNGESFTYFNGSYFSFEAKPRNENLIMKAVININDKLL